MALLPTSQPIWHYSHCGITSSLLQPPAGIAANLWHYIQFMALKPSMALHQHVFYFTNVFFQKQ
jgi:hypothetical protein